MKNFLIVLFISSFCFAQTNELYMSQPIKRAYKKGTRTFNGNPGGNYWINKTEYKIKVEVDPLSKKLDGNLSARYYNNSPDTLKKIVMRLYPDFFKKGSNRDWSMPASSINEGVEIQSVFIRDKEKNFADSSNVIKRSGTNMAIDLKEALLPGEKIDLFLDWSFYIPQIVPIRTGAYADSA